MPDQTSNPIGEPGKAAGGGKSVAPDDATLPGILRQGDAPIPLKSTRRGAGFWTPWGIVGGLAIVSVTLAVQNRALNDELRGESSLVTNLAARASHAQQVLEVLTAPEAQRVTLGEEKLPPQPMAWATYLPERGGIILLATNLKPLSAGKMYELWLEPAADGSAPVPVGQFHPDAGGTASLILPGLHSGIAAKAFSVTIEDAGSEHTRSMPVVLSGAAGN